MAISKFFACIALISYILTLFNLIRKKHNMIQKMHIPAGVILILSGIIHGILADNPASANLLQFQPAIAFLSNFWGDICLILAVILALTRIFSKIIGCKWFLYHRIATVALCFSFIMHMIEIR